MRSLKLTKLHHRLRPRPSAALSSLAQPLQGWSSLFIMQFHSGLWHGHWRAVFLALTYLPVLLVYPDRLGIGTPRHMWYVHMCVRPVSICVPPFSRPTQLVLIFLCSLLLKNISRGRSEPSNSEQIVVFFFTVCKFP